MRRLFALGSAGLFLLAMLQGASARPRFAQNQPTGLLRAGVAKADLTWHVGATGGQVANDIREEENDIDPFLHQGIKQPTQGFHDRLSARALVLEDPVTAERFAVVTTDLYLQQNLLHHYVTELLRVQALAEGREPIQRENVMISSSHNHSAPYFSTISWGVWLFVDKYDDRFTRYAAHQIAQAVERAETQLREVRFGAAVVCADVAQRNIIGPQTAFDGTPAGYPKNHYDADLTVLRFDERAAGGWRPYALWTNLGMHPESLGGGGATGMVSADFPIYLATRVERALRARYGGSPTMLLQQGSVGDVEPDDGEANHNGDACDSRGSPRTPYGASHDYWRENFRAIETFTAPLAGRVLDASDAIETGAGVSATWRGSLGDPDEGTPLPRRVPFNTAQPRVRMVDFWFAGPLDHPLPTYCNQEVAHYFEGSKPRDCELLGFITGPVPNLPANQAVADAIRSVAGADGANVFIPSTGTVQETTGIHLQALAVGDVLVGTCPCEPGSDQVKNFKARTDRVARNLWQGFEYPASWAADGQSWPAGKRQAVIEQIRNQFSRTELRDGFAITVMAGQTNDYIGYIVTERQWLARDQYRKELTPFGPGTADYVNTGLLILAREIRARDAGLPPGTVLGVRGAEDHLPAADRAAIDARDLALIAEAEAGYRAWDTAAPPDLGFDQPVSQPPALLTRLDVARFTWNGGSNWTDLPTVVVERCDGANCLPFEDQTIGDVVTSLDLPDPGEDPPPLRPWPWTAHWETRLDTPAGLYRFSVQGLARTGPGMVEAYELASAVFEVRAREYRITNVSRSSGTVTFRVDAAVPQTLPHAGLVYYQDTTSGSHPPCYRCTFRVRPVAGTITAAAVNGTEATVSGGTWSANDPGGPLTITATDAYGNTATLAVP